MSKIIKALLTVVLVLYPLLVFFGFKYFSLEGTTSIIIILFILRLSLLRKTKSSFDKTIFRVIICMLIISVIGFFFKQTNLVKLYPVIMNISFCYLFGSSLFNGQVPIVETIARLQEKDLPAEGVNYTRQVTKVWVIFFILNGSASLYTFLFSSLEQWTFYNAFLSYVFMGCLFAVEFITRTILKKRWASKL